MAETFDGAGRRQGYAAWAAGRGPSLSRRILAPRRHRWRRLARRARSVAVVAGAGAAGAVGLILLVQQIAAAIDALG